MDPQQRFPSLHFPETIFALSSGRLPAGVAVVRVSGPATRFAVETIAGDMPAVRIAQLRTLRAQDGSAIDRGLVLFFPAPRSFTGEDCAEFHVHGGRAVVDAVLQALASVEGCRMAEAGEFTRRAFAHGKLDLTEAEGLADLIAAETEAQRRLALAVAGGAQRTLYEGWRSELIRARALVEVEFDFSDEGDVPGSVADQAWRDVEDLATRMAGHIAGARRGEIIRDGFRVVIIGPPNAGKSSLLNALAGREVAIVSEEAGTTRDLLEVKLDLGGVPVLITDTAGLREAEGHVERVGIARARDRAAEADLVLVLRDLTAPVRSEQVANLELEVEMWQVGTKVDKVASSREGEVDHAISSITGAGLGELVDALERRAGEAAGAIGDVVPTRRRHLDLLANAVADLREAAAPGGLAAELRAEHLRRASTALGRITGAVDVEDLLDVIFSQFCIGK